MITGRRGLLATVAAGALLFALAWAWAVVGPRALGGPATYMIALGNSMEPGFHEGDLVVLRPADRYQIGDVVAYRSPALDRIVLHRITAVDAAGFVTKGDHNAFSDPDHPSPADVIGSVWLQLPGAGGWLDQARTPVNAATIFSLGGLLSMGVPSAIARRLLRATRNVRQRRKSQRDSLPGGAVTWLGAACALLVLTAAGSGLLALAATEQPTTRNIAVPSEYRLVGTYSYSSEAPAGVVYPDGKVHTGDPVFLRLTRSVDVRFDFQFQPLGFAAAVDGEARLDAELRSDTSGWRHTLTLQGDTPLEQGKASLAGHIDLTDLVRTEHDYLSVTGQQRDSFTLELQPRVTLRASVPGTADGTVRETFAPPLDFHLDESNLQPTATAIPPGQSSPARGDPYSPSRSGTMTRSVRQTNSLSFLSFRLAVSRARTLAFVILAGSVALLAVAIVQLAVTLLASDESTRIARRYGNLLVPVETIAGIRHGQAIATTSMESLVRLAQHQSLIVLHEVDGGRHYYAIQDGGLFYYYSTDEARPQSAGVGQAS